MHFQPAFVDVSGTTSPPARRAEPFGSLEQEERQIWLE